MSARRVLAVARRIAEGFRRDHRSLALLFIAPLFVTALLGWVLRGSVAGTIDLVVAGAPAALVDALESAAADPDLDVEVRIEAIDDADGARGAVRDGDADVALIVAGSGANVGLTIVTQGADPTTEGGQLGVVQALISGAAGALLPIPGARLPEISRETIYLSPDADQLDALAPVFLGIFAYFFVFILTGISFLRERVGGTLERLLATPVTRAEIVLGYSIGFSFFAAIQVVVLTLFILARVEVPALGPIPAFTIGLDVQTAGSPAIAFIVALLMAIGAVNLGIFLSTYARTELQIVQFIPLVILPQALLGGVFWPVERLPDVLQAIAHVLPVTYAVDALREVMIKGADFGSSVVQLDLAVLAGIAILFVVLGAGTIKREVA
ncbi:MAG: ABC transporter permease [Chloroflexota bacterium]|nr:MAG: ABC transporter permease [Chloroflexota bacterium]